MFNFMELGFQDYFKYMDVSIHLSEVGSACVREVFVSKRLYRER